MAQPFTWLGVDDRKDEPRRPRTSRLSGRRAFLATWYRALFPIPPHEVRRMTPTEVASALGLDLQDGIVPVPFADRPFVPIQAPRDAPRKVRRVM